LTSTLAFTGKVATKRRNQEQHVFRQKDCSRGVAVQTEVACIAVDTSAVGASLVAYDQCSVKRSTINSHRSFAQSTVANCQNAYRSIASSHNVNAAFQTVLLHGKTRVLGDSILHPSRCPGDKTFLLQEPRHPSPNSLWDPSEGCHIPSFCFLIYCLVLIYVHRCIILVSLMQLRPLCRVEGLRTCGCVWVEFRPRALKRISSREPLVRTLRPMSHPGHCIKPVQPHHATAEPSIANNRCSSHVW
jgi:hypothetical protein